MKELLYQKNNFSALDKESGFPTSINCKSLGMNAVTLSLLHSDK